MGIVFTVKDMSKSGGNPMTGIDQDYQVIQMVNERRADVVRAEAEEAEKEALEAAKKAQCTGLIPIEEDKPEWEIHAGMTLEVLLMLITAVLLIVGIGESWVSAWLGGTAGTLMLLAAWLRFREERNHE